MPRQTLNFLSPCFCGGAQNKVGPAELRVPSLRGQLRYWTRVLFHVPGKPNAAATKEHQLFGGIRARDLGINHPMPGQRAPDAVASRFVLQLTFRPSSPQQTSQPLCPHDICSGPRQQGKGWQQAIPAGTQFDLEWNTAISAGNGTDADLQRILKTWTLLGSLGLRANRASGSVWRCGPDASVSGFLKMVGQLELPGQIVVKVLRPLTTKEVEDWNPPTRANGKDWAQLMQNPVELLRGVATDTLACGQEHGGALGSGGPDGRKASPLKFKIGQFQEGYRLIAISDRRDARQGDLKGAIDGLTKARKPIGILLRDARFP